MATTTAAIAMTRPASARDWRSAYDHDENATFFHGPCWARLWELYTRGRSRPAPRLVEFADGRSAVLAVTTEPSSVPLLRRELLSPAGNVGGWTSSDPLPSAAHARALADEILAAASVVWRRGPSDPLASALALPDDREESTHLVSLADGAAAALARWKPAARRQLAAARRRGARVRETRARRDWHAYRDLYRACVRRWATPSSVYEPHLFDVLADVDDPEVCLFLAELDDVPAAGAVVFVHRTHAVFWHGASVSARCPGASNLLHAGVIEALVTAGVRVYDLNGSGPHRGVVRFKESLGAVHARVLAIERLHPLERIGRRARRTLVAAAGRRAIPVSSWTSR